MLERPFTENKKACLPSQQSIAAGTGFSMMYAQNVLQFLALFKHGVRWICHERCPELKTTFFLEAFQYQEEWILSPSPRLADGFKAG